MNPKVKEHRQEIADIFIRSLEDKQLNWKKEWGSAFKPPTNAATVKRYRGINSFYLSLVALDRGYGDPRWATFKQIQDNGWKLEKGAKGAKVEYWMPWDVTNNQALSWEEYRKLTQSPDPNNPIQYQLRAKYYTVFNASQIKGIEPLPEVTKEMVLGLDELVGNISNGMQLEILNDGVDRAFYSIKEDRIHLPTPESFYSKYAYNSTALHELIHASGAEKRLNRNIQNSFGDDQYAYEELVAEIGSAFVSANLPMEQDENHLKNHVAYVQSWIRDIKEDPEVLVNAIKEAEKAATYLEYHAGMDRQEEYDKIMQAAVTVKEDDVAPNLPAPVDPVALAHQIDDFMEEYDPYSYRDAFGILSEQRNENISSLEQDLVNGNVQGHMDAITGIYETMDHEDPLRITAQEILNKLNEAKAATMNNSDNMQDIISDEFNDMKDTYQYMVNEYLLTQYGDRQSLAFVDGIIAQYQGKDSISEFSAWLKGSTQGGVAIQQQYDLEAKLFVSADPTTLAHQINDFLENYDQENYRDVIGITPEKRAEAIAEIENDILNGNVKDYIDYMAQLKVVESAIKNEKSSVQTRSGLKKSPAIEMGSIGNGITVWDRNKPIYNEPNDKKHMVSDYETLAYISPDGSNITWYAEDIPKDVVPAIEEIAMKQKEAYDQENLVASGMDIKRDLSVEREAAICDLILTDPTYVMEQVSHYGTGESGDKFVSTSPLDVYYNMKKSYTQDCNLYACMEENDGEVQAYAISEEQLEKEVIKEVLCLHGLPENANEAPPLVRIGFSESVMFGDNEEYMSLFDADNRLAGYNLAAQELNGGWYEKTDFTIITLQDDELHSYDGRYDIGADSENLIDHISDRVKYEMSEENITMMKSHLKPEEYAAWETQWTMFTNKWLPLWRAAANTPQSLSAVIAPERNKSSEIARWAEHYNEVNKKSQQISQESVEFHKNTHDGLSLMDERYTFYQDGKAVRKADFKHTVSGLLTAKALGNGSEYHLTVAISEKEITLLQGDNNSLEMQVDAINHSVNITENSDMKAILETIAETVKPKVVDPYNVLDLPFNEYAAHENDNPWKNPAVMYRANGIPVSEVQEIALETLNWEFKCYLKPQDIMKISRDGGFKGKQCVAAKQELLKSVWVLTDRYVEQKPEPAAPAPDLGIQLE